MHLSALWLDGKSVGVEEFVPDYLQELFQTSVPRAS